MKVLCTTLCTYVSVQSCESWFVFFNFHTDIDETSFWVLVFYFFLCRMGRGGYTFLDEKKSQLFFFLSFGSYMCKYTFMLCVLLYNTWLLISRSRLKIIFRSCSHSFFLSFFFFDFFFPTGLKKEIYICICIIS